MFDVKVLCREDTEKLLKMNDVISVVEDVYRLKSDNKTEVFPLVFHEFEPGLSDMDIKSGWIKEDENIWGLKVVSWYGENTKKDLPPLIGTILVMHGKTGVPLGLLDGAHITGMRTGAAVALGAKYLARPNSKKLLIVGAGHTASFQIAASLLLFPQLEQVMVYGRNTDNVQLFTKNIKDVLVGQMDIPAAENVTFDAVRNIEEAVSNSDIIITVTPSKTPIIKKEWVRPGTHFSCIGADMSGKEEIDPKIFSEARVFVDDIKQCVNVGEIEIPVKQGILKEEDIAGEIGDILTGKAQGRQNNEQITVFDATGTALLDLLTAKLALKKAEEVQAGSSVNL